RSALFPYTTLFRSGRAYRRRNPLLIPRPEIPDPRNPEEDMAEEASFMRAPAPAPKRTIYTEAMEIFNRAADLINLDSRVRLELEEPDYEHIFYVTAKLRDRLVPVSPEKASEFSDLPATQVRNPEGLERLMDGRIILNG